MPQVGEPTIILIGGASTAGKSTLARTLGKLYDLRVVDTDLFWLAIQPVTPLSHEIHLFREDDVWALPADELLDRYLRISRVVCKALEAVVAHYTSIGVSAVIEGCWLLPEFAVQSEYANRPSTATIKALYLHEPSLEELSRRLRNREDGWHASQPEPYQRAHALMQYQLDLEVKRQAEALHLPVINSRPFDTLLDRALTALDFCPAPPEVHPEPVEGFSKDVESPR